MFSIYCSDSYSEEKKYIIDVILQEFLGFDFRLIFESREDILIKYSSDDEKSLSCADVFFQTAEEDWLSIKSMPTCPLNSWKVRDEDLSAMLISKNLPVIFGKKLNSGDFLQINGQTITLGLDVFGSAFFMLTRYEEVVVQERDEHDRFFAATSLSKREDFLHRPIINEYVEVLWWCLKKLWPSLQRAKRKFRIVPTHDLDQPFDLALSSPYELARRLAGDLLVRRDISKFAQTALQGYRVKMIDYRLDEYYTFEKIMAINEKYNVPGYFYLMAGQSNRNFERNNNLDNQPIQRLIAEIIGRGHKVGLHPSYETYRDNSLLRLEFDKLKNVCAEIGVSQSGFGARQHYLRWKCPDTWRIYEECGLEYDSTMSYADHIGFRCGVCYEYPVYDVKARKRLKLTERPLIFMEGTEACLGLSLTEIKPELMKLKASTQKYNGDFVFLWHNEVLISDECTKIYEDLASK